jgi:hypothetical protein
MGLEATCICDWNGAKSETKALVETPELILRGAIQRRIPLAKIKHVRVDNGRLCFRYENEPVALELGAKLAAKWAATLLKPPPSLAKKLGIAAETTVWLIGKADDDALKSALTEAKKLSRRSGDLIVARVETTADLDRALAKCAEALAGSVPIWFVYRKGPGHALNESLVRSTALAKGIVDTKVAAVSPALTGLRFIKRKG